MTSSKNQKPPYFFKSLPDLPVDIFQAIGPRSVQQDNFAVFTDTSPMTPQRLQEIFRNMAKATETLGRGVGGTTANLVCISNGKIMAANLGDSMTTLFTRCAKGDELNAQKLSTIHTPRNPDEKRRITPMIDPFNLYVANDYICKFDGMRSPALAMTRALGNPEFTPMVIQDPAIHTYELDASAFEYAQLTLYTDGITSVKDHIHRELDYYADDLASIIDAQISGQKNGTVAASHALGTFALQAGLKDNATSISLNLKAMAQDQHIVIGIFDGHRTQGYQMTQVAIAALRNTPDLQ